MEQSHQPIDAWLDAMPVMSPEQIDRCEAELEQVVTTAQRKLAVVRLLRQGDHESRPAGKTDSAPVDRHHNAYRAGRKRRLSPERTAILDLIGQEPHGMSPTEVWRRLTERGMAATTNAIQTTMGRMVKDGQLRRVDQGRYMAAAPVDDLLSATHPGTNGNCAHAEEAMT